MARNKEKEFLNMVQSGKRFKADETHKIQSIVQDINYIEACKIVVRYATILIENSQHICDSRGDPSKIEELKP